MKRYPRGKLTAVIVLGIGLLSWQSAKANITTVYEIIKSGGTPGTQRSPQLDFSVEISTSALLRMQFFVNIQNDTIPGKACSDTRLHILIDNSEVHITDWLGYEGRIPSLPLDTGCLDFSPVAIGQHTLTLSPEGRVGGCNHGSLLSWGGTLRVTSPVIPAPGALVLGGIGVGLVTCLCRRRTI